ncbi:MAG: DUF1540 domain-containing protein [Sporomusaceae bacterium]|nr:DUF1540 domain-containing protein [Sporomusaceae bacterium]
MANPVVKCTVSACTHYMPGDQCMAAKISVYNDEAKAESSSYEDTLCKSFHPGKSVGDLVGALHNANVGGTVKAALIDGTQITPQVECFVTSCKYWDARNHCGADTIHVVGGNAAVSGDTGCHTYESR